MKRNLMLAMAVTLLFGVTAWAQRGEERGGQQRGPEMRGEMRPQEGHGPPRANQGRIPAAPERRAPNSAPERDARIERHVNDLPHVANNRWYGHDRPNDNRYRVARPFPHGRFERFGPQYRYSISRFDPRLREFWFPGGFYFQIAAWDWPLAEDWCWQCGDDFVVYDDPDHPGWYLVYNIHTGQYVHAQYMGS